MSRLDSRRQADYDADRRIELNATASRYKPLALIFIISLMASIILGVFGPRILGLDAKPQWMLWLHLGLGLVSVVTVPFAWRWLYRRDAA